MFVNVAAYVLDDSCLVFAGLFGGLGQCDCLMFDAKCYGMYCILSVTTYSMV